MLHAEVHSHRRIAFVVCIFDRDDGKVIVRIERVTLCLIAYSVPTILTIKLFSDFLRILLTRAAYNLVYCGIYI